MRLWFALCLLCAAWPASGCQSGPNPLRSGPTRRRAEPTISVFFHENGTKRRMKIEEYLVGVVAGEMQPNWPKSAYAAQAILARTFTMEFLSRGGTRKLHGTDICTDEKHAQAYTISAITPQIRKAVAATRGQVMFYRNQYVHGWFSASCGGRTALATEGLAFKGGNPPYITSVDCPEASVIPKGEEFWQARFSAVEVAAALKKAAGRDVGKIQSVSGQGVDKTTHRTTKLRLAGAGGSTVVPAANLRVAIGPDRMRSIWLTELKTEDGGVLMSGRGFGHGVGLCQWGSYALAKKGQSPSRIVKHYYPNVQILKVW